MAEAVVAVADADGAAAGSSSSHSTGADPSLRHTRPEIQVSWLTSAPIMPPPEHGGGAASLDFGGSVPRAVAAEGGPTWGPDYRDLTEDSLEEAHALGLKVVPWTVNRPRTCAGWSAGGSMG